MAVAPKFAYAVLKPPVPVVHTIELCKSSREL